MVSLGGEKRKRAGSSPYEEKGENGDVTRLSPMDEDY